MGVACVSAIGVAPLPGLFDAIDHRALGVTEPVRITQSALDPSRFEPQRVADPALKLNHHSTAVRPAKPHTTGNLSQLSGEPARRLQAKLSVDVNADYPSTEGALRAWQSQNGLAADGIAGPATLMMMELYDLVLLKRGAHGEAVEKLQQRLAIGADGRFGRRTEQAVREYQKANGLVADGIAGPATLVHLNRRSLPAGTSSEVR
jgi:peptidoglycan hydrolase-like protein with peptidoglycan-binding domain